MNKIASLKHLLHGRQRKRMRLEMSERVCEMKSLLAAKKLGKLIQKLLPDYTEPLDFYQLTDSDGRPFKSSRTMQDWMRVPRSLNRIAKFMEDQKNAWMSLL